MICSKCNYNNLDDANFCAKCGTKLDKSKIVNLNKSKINQEKENIDEDQKNTKDSVDSFEIFLNEQISIEKNNTHKYQENKSYDYYNEREYDKEKMKNKEEVSNNKNKTEFPEIKKIVVGVLAIFILLIVIKNVMGGTEKVADNSQSSSFASSNIISEDNITSDENLSNNIEEDKNLESDDYEDTRYSQDYIIPDSSETILTYSDIEGLSKQEVNYAKNEIYAKHGRKFDSQKLQSYFNRKSWYNGVIDPENFNEETMLSDIEYRNVVFLSERENSM